jgi:hypothetical protein
MTEEPRLLAPSDDEFEYDLIDWAVGDRTDLTAALTELGVLYRWEDDLTLVIPGAAEGEVEALFDDFEAGAVGGVDDGGDGEVDDESLAVGAAVGRAGGEIEDGGPEAFAAMNGLFLAADRLQHVPFDVSVGKEVRTQAATVSDCLPPYGVEPLVWRRIQRLGEATKEAIESDAGDEAVGELAGQLRNLLRDYI